MQPTDQEAKSVEPANKNRLWLIPSKRISKFILLLLILVVVSGGSFWAGSNYGEDKSDKKVRDEQQQAVNASILSLPIGGTVDKISSSEITIKMIGKSTKTVKINSKTETTNRSGKIKVSDIKNNDKVVIFTNKDSKNLIATKIIVQK